MEMRGAHGIAGNEAGHPIGDVEGVLGAGPDDLHGVHIELRLAPLVRQVIHLLHRPQLSSSNLSQIQKNNPIFSDKTKTTNGLLPLFSASIPIYLMHGVYARCPKRLQ